MRPNLFPSRRLSGIVSMMLGLSAIVFCQPAHAGLIVIGDPRHNNDEFEATLGWDPETTSSVMRNLTEWDFMVSITKQATQSSGEWIARHLVKADALDTGPAPVIPRTPYSFPNNKLGPAVNQLLVTSHTPHRDAYHFLFERSGNPRDSRITLTGKHEAEPLPARWSFTPEKPGSFFAAAAYPNGTVQTIFGPQRITAQDVDRKRRFQGMIPRLGLLPATAYGIGFTDPGTIDTTLGFVSLTEDGHQALTDLDLGIDFFTGGEEFLVPNLFNPSQDLFAAVDLTQWLTFSPEFLPGQTFELINGRSDQLPGFLVARARDDLTSPIVFDPDAGFVSEEGFLFSGLVNVTGTIDGSNTIPEPASLMLFTTGLTLIGLCKRRHIMRGDPCSENRA